MRLAANCKESIQYQNLGVGFSIATKSEEDQAQVLFPNKSKIQRKRSSKCMIDSIGILKNMYNDRCLFT